MTAKELWDLIQNEDLEPVFQEFDTWRWGTVNNEVYEVDGKFWEITYRVGSEGATNDLRDGYCEDPMQVWPKEVTTTIYTTEKPNEEWNEKIFPQY